MKRILTILVIVLILAAGGGAGYYYFVLNKTVITVTPQNQGSLPNAGGTTNATTTPDPIQTVDVTKPAKVAERLAQISKGQVVAGAIAYTASTTHAGNTVVNFIERESGNVFQYFVNQGELTRISNKTIPGIQEALWKADGSLAFVRYLSGDDHATINTYALSANGSGGYFLAQNIDSMAVGATSIVTLASGTNGSTATLSKPDGSNTKKVFTTPLSALRISFLGALQYLAFTKPSATLPGFVYLVNTTGNFERIAGPLNGLTALASPSGKWVLITYSSGGILKSVLYEVATRKTLPLPVGTLADKCVWTSDDRTIYCGVPKEPSTAFAYPDDWYQGVTAFSDRIWRIDIAGRYAELTLDFEKETKAPLDATALVIDPKGSALVFRNKNDASLWVYQL